MRSKRSTRRPALAKRLLTLPAAILLASCETTTDGAGISADAIEPIAHASFCTVAKPISWSSQDTPATVAEIKEHNAVGRTLCGWGA